MNVLPGICFGQKFNTLLNLGSFSENGLPPGRGKRNFHFVHDRHKVFIFEIAFVHEALVDHFLLPLQRIFPLRRNAVLMDGRQQVLKEFFEDGAGPIEVEDLFI